MTPLDLHCPICSLRQQALKAQPGADTIALLRQAAATPCGCIGQRHPLLVDHPHAPNGCVGCVQSPQGGHAA